MPISREEFEQRQVDMTLPVARLLESRPDLAFTAEEVQQMLAEALARDAALEEVERALETLVSHGRVQTEEIEGQRWYTITERRLGFPRG